MGALGNRLAGALANTAIFLVVTAIGLLVLEFASRVLFPLPPGTDFRDEAGNSIELFRSGTLLVADLEFFQVSPDFNVRSHTGPMGLRAPEPGPAPNVIFLGDSFTFGQGLTDDQTIPAIYCAETKQDCANLGFPGTGTYRQIAILEHWLGEVGWRPQEVNLLVFAMASGLGAGNDLFDTVDEVQRAAVTPTTPGSNRTETAEVDGGVQAGDEAVGFLPWILSKRQWIRVNSNLARFVVLHIGPTLRSWFSLDPTAADYEEGIQVMTEQLMRLDALSQRYEFEYTIFLLHPMQDLMRNTFRETADAMRSAAPASVEIIDTAQALMDDPARFYFPYDGHFNPDGAQAIAQFLIDRDR